MALDGSVFPQLSGDATTSIFVRDCVDGDFEGCDVGGRVGYENGGFSKEGDFGD